MEQIRDVRLDNLCEAIAEDRRAMNRARQDEQSNIQGALQRMQQRGTTVYRHGGIELARMPGAEKLRVRLTKEEGDAGEGDLTAPGDAGGGEFGVERTAALGGDDFGEGDGADV